MGEMKVCKLVRLSKKDDKGNFVNDKEGRLTVRSRVVVSADSVAETDENFKTTGLLYVVDEKATKERDAIVETENAKNIEVKLDEDEDAGKGAGAPKL